MALKDLLKCAQFWNNLVAQIMLLHECPVVPWISRSHPSLRWQSCQREAPSSHTRWVPSSAVEGTHVAGFCLGSFLVHFFHLIHIKILVSWKGTCHCFLWMAVCVYRACKNRKLMIQRDHCSKEPAISAKISRVRNCVCSFHEALGYSNKAHTFKTFIHIPADVWLLCLQMATFVCTMTNEWYLYVPKLIHTAIDMVFQLIYHKILMKSPFS